MKIYLIRHGRQISRLCNVKVDLAEEGFSQAALLGERLAKEKIDVLYSGDLIRAVQTAEKINEFLQVEHRIVPAFREISFGEMEGRSDEEIAEVFADFQAEQKKMEWDIPYPGGECAGDVVKRVMPALEEIVASGEENVAVVTHGGVIRCLVSHILGMAPAKWRILGKSLENCSITELEYQENPGRFTVERFNDYAHLENHPALLRKSWVQAEN